MKYIAHRGLYNGPDKNLENNPNQIQKAVDHGFDCEIDLWILFDKTKNKTELFLGHDEPTYQIDIEFLVNKPFWIHAKNLEALYWLSSHNDKFVYFWHQNDDYTLTNNAYIWTFPEKNLTEKSVCLMPEWYTPIEDLPSFRPECFAICSDYVGIMRK